MRKKRLFPLLVSFLGCLNLVASEKDSVCFQNQLSLLGLLNPTSDATFLFGGMYVPQIDYLRDFSGDKRFSAQVSGKFNLNMGFRPFEMDGNVQDPNGAARLYRAWLRFSTQRNEIRAGLQQINFGSASLLRPLQWFDGIDPTDPLRMTNGVWGILDRYYFKNNSTLWLWGLYGNKESRVWEPYQLEYNLPEFGFRFQQPVPNGEMALSMNRRFVKMSMGTSWESAFSVTKIGFDGKWDVGPGIWFEDCYTFSTLESPLVSSLNLLTVGADLTPEGLDGLSFTVEHLRSTNLSSNSTSIHSNVSSLMASWPINAISRLSGIALYSWETNFLFRYLTYSADFDQSSVHLIGFWNPNLSTFQLPLGSSPGSMTGSYSGYGLQLMFVVHL